MSVSQAEGGTRSGLLWEVERILDELKDKELPQTLIMENVPEVIGSGNIKDFEKWENKLTELGYSNYIGVLNAKNYLIPQNRRRCFMMSFLGDYAYDFPMKQTLKYRLKDFLEQNVDEKYFLDEQDIERIKSWNCQEKPLENVLGKDSIMPTITTHVGKDSGGMKLVKYSDESLKRINKNIIKEDVAPTITANAMQSINHNNCGLVEEENRFVVDKYKKYAKKHNGEIPEMFNPYNEQEIKDVAPAQTTQCGSTTSSSTILIKNATEKGYLEAEKGDGIDISTRMQFHRGNVQKGLSQTLTCKGGENVGVVVDEINPKK